MEVLKENIQFGQNEKVKMYSFQDKQTWSQFKWNESMLKIWEK